MNVRRRLQSRLQTGCPVLLAAAIPCVAGSPVTAAADDVLFDPPAVAALHVLPDAASAGTRAAALAVDAAGHSIVFDSANQRIVRISAGGDSLGDFAATGGGFARLAVDDAGRVFLHSGTLRVYAPGGALLHAWSLAPLLGGVTGDGKVVAWDGDVRVFEANGDPVASWSPPGFEVHWVAVDGQDVWISGHGTGDGIHRVQRRTLSGDLVSQFPVTAHSGERIAVGGGVVWMIDWEDPVGFSVVPIRAFSADGVPLGAWTRHVSRDPYVDLGATDFAVDPSGRLRLAETYDDGFGLPACSGVLLYDAFAPGLLVAAAPPVTPYFVDGVRYVGTHRFDWAPGGAHALAADAAAETSPGTRQAFLSWSDGGALAHAVTAPAAGQAVLLRARTEHFVSVTVDSGGAATGHGWIPHGAEAALLAEPASGYRFVRWSEGEAAAGWAPTDRLTPSFAHTVTGPESWEACFIRQGLVLTISASATDPWQNTAAPAFGPRQLWLWAACLDRGAAALEADVAGSLTAFPFVPEAGVLNVGDGANLLLAIPDCPIGIEANVRLGSWWVMDDGGDFCLQPSAANGILGLVDCPSSLPHVATPSVVGFSSVGEPCRTGPPCGESVDGDVTAVAEPTRTAPAPSVLALSAKGNPFRRAVELSLDLPVAGRVDARIYDVAGRLVRTLRSEELAAGRHALAWNGRNAVDGVVPAGVYFARVESPAGRRILKLVRLR